MRYTIHEMATLLGVTPHTLRYYEKMGVIQPWTDEENGYRYYSVLDTRRFNLCRSLRAADFSLEDCKALLGSPTGAERNALLQKQIETLRRKEQMAGLAIRYLEELKRDCVRLEDQVEKFSVRRGKDAWRLEFSQNERPVKDSALEREKQQWLDCMPAARWVSRIPHETMEAFGRGEVKYTYGLMIAEEDARALGLQMTENVEFVPGGDYLSTVWKQTGRGPFDWESLRAPREWMQKQGIRFYGDAYSYILASQVNAQGEPENYHYLGIRIFS
jgi:DNA-binding transcriptional MerR regulator